MEGDALSAAPRIASRPGRPVRPRRRGAPHALSALIAFAGCLALAGCSAQPVRAPGETAGAALRSPDVPYEPSAHEVVKVMLDLAGIKPGELVYDLGCGDGRVVIAAVRERGARGVCVDIDPARIAESRENARRAGVEDRIRFLTGDLFETDIRDADVVMLFLWPEVNLKLRPKLLRELAPGTRVVSHWHDMGDWKPQREVRARADGRERPIYLWTIPPRAAGETRGVGR